MARQRDYRAEYRARVTRAREKGYTGYGQQRRSQNMEIDRIIESDPIFTGLPDDMQTRSNAILYRQGFFYTGQGTREQKRARDTLLKRTGDALDVGTWAQYYKDVVYPAKTGKQYPEFEPIQREIDWQNMTPELFDRLTGE